MKGKEQEASSFFFSFLNVSFLIVQSNERIEGLLSSLKEKDVMIKKAESQRKEMEEKLGEEAKLRQAAELTKEASSNLVETLRKHQESIRDKIKVLTSSQNELASIQESQNSRLEDLSVRLTVGKEREEEERLRRRQLEEQLSIKQEEVVLFHDVQGRWEEEMDRLRSKEAYWEEQEALEADRRTASQVSFFPLSSSLSRYCSLVEGEGKTRSQRSLLLSQRRGFAEEGGGGREGFGGYKEGFGGE